MNPREVFITGATGYMGCRLVAELVRRSHKVRALVRKGSGQALEPECIRIEGNALDGASFEEHISPADTFVQLVGVSHPSPSKAAQFRAVDLVSGRESVAAATKLRIGHFIYVSVAHPAPFMKAYIEVRSEVEGCIRSSGLNATILRPWYVLGPGHRWPYALLPLYWMLEHLPKTRQSAQRLGLVTLKQMLATLVQAVENPANGIRILEVPQIRKSLCKSAASAAPAT